VRTGKDYSREYMNNPAMFRILGDIQGKKILDLGCGEGCNSRIMARKGASVVGIDFSKEMIYYAIQEEQRKPLGIDYHVLDATDLHIFNDRSFDIVTCFMALHDIEDYRGALKEVARVLKKRGRLVFVIPHPCFEATFVKGKRINDWEYREGARDKSNKNALYYKVDHYFHTGKYTLPWEMDRLKRPFKATSFHRTLTDYSNALYDAGLMISGLDEPKPTKKGLKRFPGYFGRSFRVPSSIVIEAVKL